jgi:hypothetical protein
LEVRYLRPFLKASIEKYMLSVPSCRNVARLLLIAGLSIFMSGCGTTLSPVKRKPVQVSPLETTLPSSSQRILFRFENTLPGTPLTETVWDNVAGPFASAKESKQIGFTQDYGTLIPATVAGGPAAGAYVGTQPDYTRIVIPFGRIFQGVFQSGLEKVYPNSLVCLDDTCETDKLQSPAPGHVVRLKVAEFRVWEKPLNHLNLSAMVECRVYQAGLTNQPVFMYEARQQITNQSIGSIMTTSSGFIREMNKISNRFGAALSEDILENLHGKIGD